MFFRVVFFFLFFLIHFVAPNSNQEDLTISTYSHVGCLMLNFDKLFITNGFQENSLFPYQTFSSPNLTIDLCFRLCRRWTILMNNNHTNCICLYTINELYEINEHLGEVSSINNCTSHTLEIYSLTKDPYLLPSLTPNDDWSLEGCYRLDGIQAEHASISLTDMNYTMALNSCRKHCQTIRNPTFFSFFLSFRKFCYCLPIKLAPSINTTAIRKPLVHCSFLPYIKKGFDNSFNESSIHINTVVKINVQRYCSSSFIFDRSLYLCLKLVLLDRSNSYLKINSNDSCLPVSVRTYEQYQHLISLLPLLRSRTFIWINRNSTYLFDDLFKSKVNALSWGNLCLIINRAQSPSYDLVPCSNAQVSDYIFCTQRPMETVNTDQSEFKSIQPTPIMSNISCPSGFILFNNLCYYVGSSFVYNVQAGEQVCSDKYRNSSLVKFDSHQWGNANTTRFLGRAFDDILLELFYYQLEKKSIIDTKNSSKHWLRLLVGDKNDENECVLRYFTRSTGAFTIFPRCNQGGHPVCQSQPILINETINNSSEIEIKPESTTTEIPLSIIPNGRADEDLDNSTNISIQVKKSRSKYLSLLTIILISLLVLITLISTVLFIYYFRRGHGSYSTRNGSRRSKSRTKHLPTPATSDETSNTAAVLYTRLQTSPSSIPMEFDNSVVNDDQIHLLPESKHPTIRESIIAENNEEDEPFYAILKSPNDK